MAFGKTVRAEAANLLEAIAREGLVIAARNHALDHQGLEFVDRAEVAKRCHGATQLIGLLVGKFGGDHGELHRLLLK